MKYCGKCGCELDSNTGFCPVCDKSQSSKNDKTKRFKKRFIIIPVALLLVCITVALCLTTCGKIDFLFKSGSSDNGKIEVKHCTYDDVSYKNGELFVKSQLLITASADYKYSDITNAVSEYNGQIVGYIEFTNDYQVEFSEMDYDTLNATQEELNKILENTDIMLNKVCYQDEETDKTPISEFEESDENGNWWRDAIKLTDLEADNNSYKEIKVGVYDTLFDADNEDLKYAINQDDIWYNDENLIEVTGNGTHGTDVTGFLAAKKNNDYGIDGVANNVKIYGYAFMGNTPQYHPVSIMDLKYWNAKMLAKGAKIINISAGNGELLVAAQNNVLRADYALKQISESLGAFYRKYIDAGYEFVIVKSAGNENGYQWIKCTESKDNPYGIKKYDEETDGAIEHYDQVDGELFDAKYDIWGAITDSKVKNRIIVVGSSAKENVRAYHSVSGERVDIYAPGERLRDLTGDKPSYGTSFAAPMVSGSIALMWGINPDIEADKIKYLLVSSATQPIEDENYQVSPEDGNYTKMYKCLLDTKNAVDMAKTYKITPKSTENKSSSFLCGMVRIYEDGKIEYNKEDCKITIYNDNNDSYQNLQNGDMDNFANDNGTKDIYKELQTDEYGEFETEIEPGNYIITAETKDGSYKSDRFVFHIESGDAKYINDLYMYKDLSGEFSNYDFQNDKYLIDYNGTVYYVDQSGLWENTGESESELLYGCKATNIATNGEVIYYSVYNKDTTAYCEDFGQDQTWHQYDMYCYDLRTSSNQKVTSFVECGKPICVYNHKVYYTDRPDDFTGNVVGLAQNLYSFDLNTGKTEYITDGANYVETCETFIFYRDMDAANGDSTINCYDMTNGNIKIISSEKVSDFYIDKNSLFYVEHEFLTSNNGAYSGKKVSVTKYNILDGTTEKLFEETGENLTVQYVNENYIYYSKGSSSAPQRNYRIDLSNGSETLIEYKSGEAKVSDGISYRVFKTDSAALYYTNNIIYFYQANDNDSYAIPYKAFYEGLQLLTVSNDGVFVVREEGDYYFYDIVRYKFDRDSKDVVFYR